MNLKKYFLAVLAVFITFELTNFVIHSLVLSDMYQQTASVWRADMMGLMWLMYIADFIFVAFFAYVYTRWANAFTALKGLQYGVIVGIMTSTVGAINQYVVYPIPSKMLTMWIIFGLLQAMICGIVLGLIYKPKKEA